MKASEIVIGSVYSDGKAGVREVISIEPDARFADDRVVYRILAAKVEQEYSYAEKQMVSILGNQSQCNLASFATWAKIKVEDVDGLLATLSAKKLKLPPGEKAFMLSLGEEYVDCTISFVFSETRQARRLEKKGLLTVMQPDANGNGEVELTRLGVAWMQANTQQAGGQ